jgi:serine/threonine protein kinase
MNDPSQHPTFAAPDPAALSSLFPGYDIECLIATGGMGAVYRAVQRSLDRVVAIKILPREFGADPSFRESFEAEAKAMAKLNHPNLIGVFDFGEVDGMLFIIMEFVSGGSLYHHAYGRAMDGIIAAQMVSGVCEGLSHAHEHGILHRDIKPANILLDNQTRPKIGDFGLARVIGKQVEAGETVYGTPHYTAPEVVSHPGSVDARADIFSIGVMLHELLTGKLPANDPRPPSAICGCDTRFDAIVKRATNPLPNLRYLNAASMAKDLKGVLEALNAAKARASVAPGANRPGAARPSSPAPYHVAPAPAANRPARRPPATSIQSKKGGSSGMIVVVLILIAAAAGYVVMKKLSPPSPKASPSAPTAAESIGLSTNKPPETKPKPREVKPIDPPSVNERPNPPKRNDFEEKQPEVVETPTKPSDPAFVEQPDPVPAPPTSTFDVPGFLTKAKDIMMAKAKPSVVKRDESLVKNVDSLGKALKRVARRAEYGQDYMEEQIDKRLGDIRDNGNRIPVDNKLDEIARDKIGEQLRDAYKEHLTSQTKIDELLSADLATLSRTYITGIELQIKRLKPTVDDLAIEALKAEISNTATDSSHFETLLLGPKEVEEDPDKDKNKDNPFR